MKFLRPNRQSKLESICDYYVKYEVHHLQMSELVQGLGSSHTTLQTFQLDGTAHLLLSILEAS